MDKTSPLRLGFPVKVVGAPDLKSHDARRWQSHPHLRVSLEHLDRVFDYLARQHIRMYRLSSDLAPYATHPDMPQFHGMIREAAGDLARIGRKARELDIRLSFHPSQYVVINTPDPVLLGKSVRDLEAQAEMLDLMGLGPEAVVVLHVGGTYGDREQSRRRWIEAWRGLADHVRRRLVLEHDDLRFSAADVLAIHEATGVRLIFDHQHFCCLNPEALDLRPTLERMLATWQGGARPKIHFSLPRTALLKQQRRDPGTGRQRRVVVAPPPTAHADLADPFAFVSFMREARELEFDVMLEAKAKDVALLRLSAQFARHAPDVARRFGIAEPVDAAANDAAEHAIAADVADEAQ